MNKQDVPVTTTMEIRAHLERIYEHPLYQAIPLTPVPRFQGYWNTFCQEADPKDLAPLVLAWQTPITAEVFKAMGNLLPFITFNLVRDAVTIMIGTVIDFTQVYGWTWCHSRQRGFLSMAIDSKWQIALVSPLADGQSLKYAPPVKVTQVKSQIKVCMLVLGPNIEDVATYEGVGDTVDTISTADADYHVCGLRTKVRTPVPLEVKAIWQRRVMEDDFSSPELRSGAYYNRSIGSYSSWSLGIHMDQVKDVLKNVPLDWTVIAPADGLGVVARSWAGKLVSGDQIRTEQSHPETRMEMMERTLERGVSQPGPKLIVFSYCWDWVSKGMKSDLARYKLPFVVLQPTDNLRVDDSMLKFRHYGPGLHGCFIPDDWQFFLHSVERFRPHSTVLYSENLILQKGFQAYSYSDYFKYFTSMKPMAPMYCHWHCSEMPLNHVTDKKLPHLAATLDEVFSILEKDTSAEIYFGPIGRLISRMVIWDFKRAKETAHYVAPAREIIVVPKDWAMIQMVRKHFPFIERQGLVYFYCSSPQVIPLHVSLIIRYGHTAIGRVEFVDRSMVSDYHPFIRHDVTNLVMLSQNHSLNACVCSVVHDADIAKIILHFFSDGECPLYFLQELVQFASQNHCSVGMSKWKDLRPKAIVQLASQSKLKFKDVEMSCHCSRFNPYCSQCRERVVGSPPLGKPCACYNQALLMGPLTTYPTAKEGMSDRVVSPSSVAQLSECLRYDEMLYKPGADEVWEGDQFEIETEVDLTSTWFYRHSPIATTADQPTVAFSIPPSDDGIGESHGGDEDNPYL